MDLAVIMTSCGAPRASNVSPKIHSTIFVVVFSVIDTLVEVRWKMLSNEILLSR